jgi:hypothetical protein
VREAVAADVRPSRRFRRAALLLCLVLLGLGFAMRSMTATSPTPPLQRFAPEALATLEQQAWQAYYERRWLTLARLLFQITREQFGLPVWQVPHATYLATRAQIVFARQGDAGGEAEAYMRRFYAVLREADGGSYDAERVAAAEVEWWVVHRHREDYPDATALTDALERLYVELYGIAPERARPAALHRAQAMDLSDRWVRDGKDPSSPLLGEIRAELLQGYVALKQALDA